MQVTDLIHYNHVVRESYLEAMSKLPWEEVVAPRGLSFDSMRDVFVHLTLVEDRWISFILVGRFSEWVDPAFNVFTNMDELEGYMWVTHQNTDKYLLDLSEQELNRQIILPWSKQYTTLPVEACLTHMVMEDMVHYGELSAAFWQMGQEAPYRAYWQFKTMQP
jgi:uncharacterized damage-inducible protein DinB